MNNIVIVNQGGMRYIFNAPLDVKLKKGDKVKCDTCHGVTDGTVWADSLFVDDETAELIGNLMGARFPLKSVVGKEVTSVEMFDKPQQEDKPKYKVGQKVKIVKPLRGCSCANGKVGIVTNKRSTNGLVPELNEGAKLVNVESGGAVYCVNADGIEPYTEPETKPVKLYCVENYPAAFTKGKVYEVKDDEIKYDDGSTGWFPLNFEIAKQGLKNLSACLVPLVKREAKKDEWVYMVEDYCKISKGTLAKCIEEDNDGVHLFENADGNRNWICERRYLVLDGYVPEPKYYNGEVVCVETNDCFTMGQVYKFVNGKVKDDDGDERLINGSGVESLDKWNEKYGISYARFIEFKGKSNADK